MGDVIDITRLLEGESHAGEYARGLLCIALAFAKYADVDPDQLAVLIAEAQDAQSVDQATVGILKAVGYW